MKNAWMAYASDFDGMTDDQIQDELYAAQSLIDENESWVEAVASWEAAGKPRGDAMRALIKEGEAA